MMKTTALAFVLAAAGCGVSDDVLKRQDDAEFHYKLGNGYFYDKEIVNALSELQQCLALSPDHPDAHHLMGFIFFGKKEYAQAETHFRKALSVRPGFHEARANLGALLVATHRWQEAIEALEPLESATLYPTPWLALNNIAYSYQKLKKTAPALKYYRLALFNNPKFCLGYNNLGALYKEMGQSDMAIDYLQRATARCKQYPEPHFHLGEIYLAEGRTQDARAEFSQCYKSAPESSVGRRCKVRM